MDMMKSKTLSMAVLSDIHLGHRKTPTHHIIDNLEIALPDNEETGKLDIIFIPGDLFDRFLNLPQDEVHLIEAWMCRLLRICKRRDIMLRILEGTPSHDWKQSRMMDTYNKSAEIEADAKYIPVLSIEYIERYGIHVLYIPDEWSADNDDTWLQVQQLLHEHQLDKVDLTIMHGQFAYQLPAHVDVPVHVPERYMSITRHYVFCGHVHKPSTKGPICDPKAFPSDYGSIIVPGSFDRLTHGEEEAKGHWRVTIHQSGQDEIRFIENCNARIYKTIDVSGLSIDNVLIDIDRVVQEVPLDSALRIAAHGSDAIMSSMDMIKKKYPSFQWDTKRIDDSKSTKETINDMRVTFKSVPITPKSVNGLVEELLIERGVESDQIKACIDQLETFK